VLRTPITHDRPLTEPAVTERTIIQPAVTERTVTEPTAVEVDGGHPCGVRGLHGRHTLVPSAWRGGDNG
jgi:hypothetical protein